MTIQCSWMRKEGSPSYSQGFRPPGQQSDGTDPVETRSQQNPVPRGQVGEGVTCWGHGAGGDAAWASGRAWSGGKWRVLGRLERMGAPGRWGGLLGLARVAGVGAAGENLGSYCRVGFGGAVPTEPLGASSLVKPPPPRGLSCVQQMLVAPAAGEAELRTIPHLRSTGSPSLGHGAPDGPCAWRAWRFAL